MSVSCLSNASASDSSAERRSWNICKTFPNLYTICLAMRVACCKSLLAPLVTAALPNTSSSAARPPGTLRICPSR